MMIYQCRLRAIFPGWCFIVRRFFPQHVIGRGERATVSLRLSPHFGLAEQDYESSMPIAARVCFHGIGDWYAGFLVGKATKAWQLLAGVPIETVEGTNISVFAGLFFTTIKTASCGTRSHLVAKQSQGMARLWCQIVSRNSWFRRSKYDYWHRLLHGICSFPYGVSKSTV